jgi:Conjugative transposon protein TcpC
VSPSVFDSDEDDDFEGILDGGTPKQKKAPQPKPLAPSAALPPRRAKEVPAPRQSSAPVPAQPPRAEAPHSLPVAPQSLPKQTALPTQSPKRSASLPEAPKRTSLPSRQTPVVTPPSEESFFPTDNIEEPAFVESPRRERPTRAQEQRPAAVRQRPTQRQVEPEQAYYEDEEYDDYVEEAPQRDRRRQPASQVRYVETDDEEDSPRRGKGKGKNKRGKKKNKDDEENSALAGGRARVLIVRYAVLGGIIILAGLGVKSVIMPEQFPSPEAIVDRVQEGLNLTDFPADLGEGFALGFVRSYLTVTTDGYQERETDLARYTTPEMLTSGGMTLDPALEQKVVAGPYISGVRYIDDNNAMYTISTKVSDGSWIYLAVPVYYNETSRAMVVTSSPTLVPAPKISEVPVSDITIPVEEEATEAARNAVTSFFQAWGKSDTEALSVVVSKEADPRANNGLGGSVEFQTLDNFVVYAPDANAESSVLEAEARVTWNVVNAPSDDPSAPVETNTTTFTGTYQMLLEYSGDGKWYVQDILPKISAPQAVAAE